MGNRSAILKKVAQAKATGGGNPLTSGRYRLVVDAIKMFDGNDGLTFVAEFRVRTSENVPDAKNENGGPDLAALPGSTRSVVYKFEKHKSSHSNAVALVEGLFGAKDIANIDVVLEEISNEDPSAKDDKGEALAVNPLRGWELDAESFQKPILSGVNKGKPFTNFKWRHVELSDKQITANKAWLAANAKGE